MSKLVVEIISHKFISELESTNIEIVARIMSIIGRKGKMSGKDRKLLATEVITHLIEDEDMRKSFINLIDIIYDLHKGTLWNELIEKVDVSNIDAHIKNKFPFVGKPDYNDMIKVIAYLIELMDWLTQLTPSQRKENVINTMYELIKSHGGTRDHIKDLVDLVIKIKNKKFTIDISRIKRLFMTCCCKL